MTALQTEPFATVPEPFATLRPAIGEGAVA